MIRDTFLTFAKRLGVKVTRAQRVLCAVAFDGAEPRDLKGADRDIAFRLFGAVETIPPSAREVFVAVCGARAGKSYVLVALRMLHLALTVDLATLAPGESASAIIVAPDLRLARQALRYVEGAIEGVPRLKAMVSGSTTDSIAIARDGREVVIECLPATRGGSAVRGRSLVGAALDEAAFFRDADYQINDEEVFRALAPRITPGGQVVIASTPWAEVGLLRSLFVENMGKPATALAAHAPTELLRSDARILAMVRRERERDAINAAREFDALFLAGGAMFFSAEAIEQAIERERPEALEPRPTAACGADWGYRNDASAAVIVQEDEDGFLEVADLVEIRPRPGTPLRPSEVVREVAELANAYGCRHVTADAVYSECNRELLREHRLALCAAPAGQSGKVAVFLNLKKLIHEGRLRIPAHAGLIRQMRELAAKPTSGGGLQLISPRRQGSHGDILSALALAAWEASKGSRTAPYFPPLRARHRQMANRLGGF